MLSSISSSVAVTHQQAVSLLSSPSSQTSRFTFPHPTDAAKSNFLCWGFGRSSTEWQGQKEQEAQGKAAGGSSVFLLALCWCRSSRGNTEGWTNLAVCPRQTAGSSGMGCANKAALSVCPEQLCPLSLSPGQPRKQNRLPLCSCSPQRVRARLS